MTTFQDPPPQSRRAVRQSERGDAVDQAVGPTFVAPVPVAPVPVAPVPIAPVPIASQPVAPQAAPFADQQRGDMWDTTARRVAELPNAQPRPEGTPPTAGRRAAALPEPLNYSTQQRPAVPSYDAPFRNRPTAVPPLATTGESLPPTVAIPQSEQPTYRVRDYSPESRPAAAAWNAATASTAPASDLEYHTEARRLTAVPPLPPEPTPAPVSAAPPVAQAPTAAPESSVPETTLSRRELRAQLLAEAAYSEPLTQPAAPQSQPPAGQLVEPAPWPQAAAPVVSQPTQAPPTPPASDAPLAWPMGLGEQVAAVSAPAQSTFEQPIAPQAVAPQPIAPRPEAPAQDGARELFGDIMTPISAPLTVTPEPPTAVAPVIQQPQALQAPVQSPLPAVAPEPLANTGLTNAINEFDALTRGPSESAGEVVPASSPISLGGTEPVWSPPVGHWSTQGDLDDETQPYESTINRRIGSGSATTNALVLPNLDRDIRGALTGTGEVMLTGSIDLPTTLSSTGASDRVEHESLDMLFDANDHEIVATDSAPVRAIRAVSTHNTGHGVTHTQKPKGNRGLTVLLFVAGGFAVVGLGMLITVLVINVF